MVLIPCNNSLQRQMLLPINHVSFRFIDTTLPLFFGKGAIDELSALMKLQNQCDIVHYQAPPVDFDLFAPSILRFCRKKQTYWYTGDVHNYPLRYSLFKLNQKSINKIMISDSYTYQLSKKNGISEKKFVYIPEPINMEMFDRAQPIALEGTPSVLYVGRLHPDKDLTTLIKAIYLVKAELPNVRLHIVGSGRDEINCRLLIGKLGLKKSVIMHGSKLHSQLPSFYKGADMVVYPIGQFFTNGPGLVTLEALASKKPLLTSIHSGARQLLKDGENALLSPIGNDQLLAQNISKIHFDENLASRISQNGYDLVRKFDWSKIVLEFIKTWRELLE
jgi:glycosyltransferase involved in cell wall biosynthesis